MAQKGEPSIISVINPGFLHKIEQQRTVSFSTALALTGFGRFHWALLLTCGLIYLSAGFQNGLSAYVIPAAQCDLRMTSEDKGFLNAIFLIGGLSSAFVWGILADQIGRRKILIWTVFADALITIASSFSQTFSLLAFFRFLNGFVIGAPSSIVCTYLAEFIGFQQRARCLVLMGFFFTLSWMILPLVAMFVLPLQWKVQTDTFIFNSWRLFILLESIPTLISGLLLVCFFPESPKFLYSQGKEAEAVYVMRRMYESNFGSRGEFPVDAILSDSMEGSAPRRSLIKDLTEEKNIWSTIWRDFQAMSTPPILSATALSSALMFCNMFGYYGFGLWLPELFDRFDDHYKSSNRSVTVCELTRLLAENEFTTNSSGDPFCDKVNVEQGVYINTFIIGIVCLAMNIGCSLLANPLGLKFLSAGTTLISGACAIVIYFVSKSTDTLIISCFFLGSVGAANSVISSAICDLFPTRIRALAVCAAMFAGRAGAMFSNLILGYVLDSLCEVPIFLMAGTLIVGAVLAIFLPGRGISKKISPEG